MCVLRTNVCPIKNTWQGCTTHNFRVGMHQDIHFQSKPLNKSTESGYRTPSAIEIIFYFWVCIYGGKPKCSHDLFLPLLVSPSFSCQALLACTAQYIILYCSVRLNSSVIPDKSAEVNKLRFGYVDIWISGYLDICISGYLESGYLDIWIS